MSVIAARPCSGDVLWTSRKKVEDNLTSQACSKLPGAASSPQRIRITASYGHGDDNIRFYDDQLHMRIELKTLREHRCNDRVGCSSQSLARHAYGWANQRGSVTSQPGHGPTRLHVCYFAPATLQPHLPVSNVNVLPVRAHDGAWHHSPRLRSVNRHRRHASFI